MRNDLTDITLIVDRSGSMQACLSDAQGGINTFIEEQKKADGDALLTLIQFDTEYEFVHQGKPIQETDGYTLVPRGMTALLDAVGRGINSTGERLASISEEERPGCVVVAIVTDGHENSSKEFKRDQIRQMIEEQQNKWKWNFTFLGADQNAFDEGVSMGIPIAGIAVYDPAKHTGDAYVSASANVSRMRSATMKGEVVKSFYTAEERWKMTTG